MGYSVKEEFKFAPKFYHTYICDQSMHTTLPAREYSARG